ncbi:1-acyl-sn-glycerol-3-phosphate acyltransferase [Bombilactobacillus folatiphilus]|uniref:1-acyl-sn-glycerol-3-phosphate acyltransferase n=1 Tax=Bombilactobacillus folatiphilus TaxID=2923362 RepID=A0ABY4P7E9_9LACO|nr:1-acyl-sn-glycerol-3-phosphate acyltransferase [Bombilactobacillus folatiphilus]UQS81521.1 1-acyl-sn-glycerol-3-phosphate acyltransferase [Bombilactobacillus folatiphilus]
MTRSKTIYYQSYSDDVIVSKNQSAKLKRNHRWLHHNLVYRFLSQTFSYLVVILGFIYCYGWLHLKFKNLAKLRHNNQKGGIVYCNHTQPLGDALLPFLVAFPKRPYIICDQANLGIPIIGKLLTFAGALVIPDGKTQFSKFNQAVKYHLQHNELIFIYPEAHVWPYFTKIRPFVEASFHYSATLKVPSFSLTTTYQKKRCYRRPQMISYLDGPFYVTRELKVKQNQRKLYHDIRQAMIGRSRASNFNYINYQQRRHNK